MTEVVHQYLGNPFISTWTVSDTDLDKSISLPLLTDGKYDFIVEWGDATKSHFTSYSDLLTIKVAPVFEGSAACNLIFSSSGLKAISPRGEVSHCRG